MSGEHEGLRALVGTTPPLDESRNDAEDRVFAAMPGDDISEHPLGGTNPFSGRPYTELKALARDRSLPREEQVQVQSALHETDLHHLHPHTSRVTP